MGLHDVHAHLTHPRLWPDIDAVLQRARSAGLTRIISNGLNGPDNRQVADLAARSDLVRPAFGLYPIDAVLPEMTAAGIDYPRAPSEERPEDVTAWIRDHACLLYTSDAADE